MKTVLITGVSGYLGSHLAKVLKRNNYKVIGLDIRHTSNRYVDMFFCGDVTNQDSLEFIFDRIRIDLVFHLAGRIEVGESIENPTEFFHVNVGGTCQILNCMKKYGVKNIVYSSTAGVYLSKDEPLNEDDETTFDNNPYAASKLCAEKAIQKSGLNYVIFRYFNLSGADEDLEFGENHVPETHLIPKIFQNLNKFTIYGNDYSTPDGTCIRDYVHVNDVADAHALAATHLFERRASKIFNLGTGKGFSVNEIVFLAEKITGKLIDYEYLPRRPGDPPSLVANIRFAETALTYWPKRDIITILKTAYEWQNKDD